MVSALTSSRGSRAKQSAHSIRKCTARYSEGNVGQVVAVTTPHHTGLWTSTGFSWQPEVASGVNLTGCYGFALVHVTVGGNSSSPECVRNCSNVMGRYVSQQCQMRTDCCI